MKHILLLFCALALSAGMYAQGTDENEQVLVFRHSGEVNLFYASELDSIVLSCYDADSVVHDEIVSQLFYARDTTMLVPIAEIDSVAFGSRNEMVLNSSVHELLDDIDFPWIIRTEGNTMYYRTDTPDNILPKMGDKLYYPGMNDFIPTGLAAEVISVEVMNSEIAVTLEEVELTEIFDKLFYAGRIGASETSAKDLPTRAEATEDLNKVIELKGVMQLGKYGTLAIAGETDFTDSKCIVDIFRNYYYAKIKADTEVGLEWVWVDTTFVKYADSIAIFRLFPPIKIAGVINLTFYARLFFESKADLKFDYSIRRHFTFEYEWTKGNKDDEAKESKAPEGPDMHKQDEAKVELLLNGEVFFGPEVGVDFCFITNKLGSIVADVKTGVFFNGSFGYEALRKFGNDKLESNINANIEAGLKMNLNISAYTFQLPKDIKEIFNKNKKSNMVKRTLYSHDFILYKYPINLLPQFKNTRAVQAKKQVEMEVSAATKVENEIPVDLKTGFQIETVQGEVIDSVFLEKPIAANEIGAQEFYTTIELPEDISEADSLLLRPIIKYSDYTIIAPPVRVMNDDNIMPITSYTTNGVGMYIAGASVVGTAKVDSTVYHIGNYIPVPMSLYESNKKVGGIIEGRYMVNNSIIGTWIGKYNGEDISVTFKDDDGLTGTYVVGDESRSFKYSLNKPQSGDVRLLFEDETAIVITIINVNDTTLKYYNKNDKTECTLNRQY